MKKFDIEYLTVSGDEGSFSIMADKHFQHTPNETALIGCSKRGLANIQEYLEDCTKLYLNISNRKIRIISAS